jgi:hypothetical protein
MNSLERRRVVGDGNVGIMSGLEPIHVEGISREEMAIIVECIFAILASW